MNNAQFMKVIKLAWTGYMEDYRETGSAFICNEAKKLHSCGKISYWEYKQARNKIAKMIECKYTLANYLIHSGARAEKSRKLAKAFWENLIDYYDIFGDVLPSKLIIEQIKIRFPESFQSETYET